MHVSSKINERIELVPSVSFKNVWYRVMATHKVKFDCCFSWGRVVLLHVSRLYSCLQVDKYGFKQKKDPSLTHQSHVLLPPTQGNHFVTHFMNNLSKSSTLVIEFSPVKMWFLLCFLHSKHKSDCFELGCRQGPAITVNCVASESSPLCSRQLMRHLFLQH